MIKTGKTLCIALLSISLLGCPESSKPTENPILTEIVYPDYFPPLLFPEDNQFSSERWELGKKLFFDKRFSKDGSLSCASCHKPQFAFGDNKPLSPGIENRAGTSNTPSLANIGFNDLFNRDGGVPTLEMQVLVPIQEHNEFDDNIVLVAERLAKIPEYNELSRIAYNRDFDYYVLTRALANFQRSLISQNSKYDRVRAGIDRNTREQQIGRNIFFGKGLCITCHSNFSFGSSQFENNGLYLNYENPGRARITNKASDRGKFRVPNLRNLSYTAPYMHDGSLATLEDVVEHYNFGGVISNLKSIHIRPMNLTSEEKKGLVAFLKSLDDPSFIKNKYFREHK